MHHARSNEPAISRSKVRAPYFESDDEDKFDLDVFDDSPPRRHAASRPPIDEDEDGDSMAGEDGYSDYDGDGEEIPLLLMMDDDGAEDKDEFEFDEEKSASESESVTDKPTPVKSERSRQELVAEAAKAAGTLSAGYNKSNAVRGGLSSSSRSPARTEPATEAATTTAEVLPKPEDVPQRPPKKSSHKVMKSSLPLVLASKGVLKKAQDSQVLVQLADSKLRQVEGATGSVGRLQVIEKDDKDVMVLDLVGTESWADVALMPSLLVVDIGKEAATVECIYQSMIELRTRRDHLSDLNPFTTGTHEGFELQDTDEEKMDDDGGNSTDDEPMSKTSARKRKSKKRKTSKGRGKRAKKRGSRA